MKKLLLILLGAMCLKTASFAKVLKHSSGIPLVLTTDSLLNHKLDDVIDYTVSVSGFLYIDRGSETAYLFNSLSNLIAFESDSSLLVVVPPEFRSKFESRSLCHVVLSGTVLRNGLSNENFILSEVTYINTNEVFQSNNDKLEEYICFGQKINSNKRVID